MGMEVHSPVHPVHPYISSIARNFFIKLIRKNLIDYLDAIFSTEGPVKPSIVSSNILSCNGSVFVDKAKDIRAGNAHFLILSLWCMDIITFNFQSNLTD